MRLLYLFLLFTSFFIISCQKEFSNESGGLINPVNAAWTNTLPTITNHPARLHLNGLTPSDILFSYNNATNTTLPLGKIYVLIPTNCFVKQDNSAVIGTVDIKIKKATKFSEMLYYNLATVTNTDLLSTDGMIKIEATQGTEVLKVASGKKINVAFEKSSANNYQGFIGATNNEPVNNITWTVNNTWQVDSLSFGIAPWPGPATSIKIDSCVWVNCDYFYNQPNPTNIYVKMPTGYGNANTLCYAIFRTDKVMTGLKADVNNQQFWQGTNYKVPTGKAVRIIAIARKDNKTYYGFVDAIITTNGAVTIPAMQEVSDADLQTTLNTL